MTHLSTDDPELHRQFVHDAVKTIRADLLALLRNLSVNNVQQCARRAASAQIHLADIQSTLDVLARLADEEGDTGTN